MSREITDLMEKAMEQAELLQSSVKKCELARTSLEALNNTGSLIRIRVHQNALDSFELTVLPEDKLEKIIDVMKEQYNSEIKEARDVIEKILKTEGLSVKDVEHEVSDHSNQLPEENTKGREEEASSKVKLQSWVKEKIQKNIVITEPGETLPETFEEKKANTKETQEKRVSTVDKISDEELDRLYYKQNVSIPVIASMHNVNASALYKRLEKIREKKFKD